MAANQPMQRRNSEWWLITVAEVIAALALLIFLSGYFE
jgi:hypothetical protein